MLSTILTIVLAIAFLAAGAPKLIGVGSAVEQVTVFGYPAGFARLVGLAELSAAGLLAWGIWDSRGVIAGSAIVILVMLGALYSHIARGKDPFAKWAPAAGMLVIAAVLLGMTV